MYLIGLGACRTPQAGTRWSSNSNSSFVKPHYTYWSIPKSHSKLLVSCIVGALGGQQVHIQVYFHTLTSISRSHGTSYHLLSNPFWVPLYMAWTFVPWLDWLLVFCLGERIFHCLTHGQSLHFPHGNYVYQLLVQDCRSMSLSWSFYFRHLYC